MNTHEIAQQLYTVRDFLRFGVTRFGEADIYYGHGTDNAWDEALSLVLSVLHLPVDSSEHILDARLLEQEKLNILAMFQRRIEDRVPVPYLTHTAWFCGLPFYVDERVLIPRSPIAELIKSRFKPWYQGDYPYQMLDLCTGSGCIGIACAFAFPDAEVVLADISEDALAVAERNIAKHELQASVFTQRSDLFSDIDGIFDIIVSNPPYVDNDDLFSMPAEFRHEPTLALASGELGLHHPVQILQQAAQFLTDDGLLILEVGNSGRHLEAMYPGVEFNWIECQNGGHGVLAISKAELEYYADQLALSPEAYDDEGDF
jgi:ribosomal protein L3 glutamine methyltransferase